MRICTSFGVSVGAFMVDYGWAHDGHDCHASIYFSVLFFRFLRKDAMDDNPLHNHFTRSHFGQILFSNLLSTKNTTLSAADKYTLGNIDIHLITAEFIF